MISEASKFAVSEFRKFVCCFGIYLPVLLVHEFCSALRYKLLVIEHYINGFICSVFILITAIINWQMFDPQ